MLRDLPMDGTHPATQEHPRLSGSAGSRPRCSPSPWTPVSPHLEYRAWRIEAFRHIWVKQACPHSFGQSGAFGCNHRNHPHPGSSGSWQVSWENPLLCWWFYPVSGEAGNRAAVCSIVQLSQSSKCCSFCEEKHNILLFIINPASLTTTHLLIRRGRK